MESVLDVLTVHILINMENANLSVLIARHLMSWMALVSLVILDSRLMEENV